MIKNMVSSSYSNNKSDLRRQETNGQSQIVPSVIAAKPIYPSRVIRAGDKGLDSSGYNSIRS